MSADIYIERDLPSFSETTQREEPLLFCFGCRVGFFYISDSLLFSIPQENCQREEEVVQTRSWLPRRSKFSVSLSWSREKGRQFLVGGGRGEEKRRSEGLLRGEGDIVLCVLFVHVRVCACAYVHMYVYAHISGDKRRREKKWLRRYSFCARHYHMERRVFGKCVYVHNIHTCAACAQICTLLTVQISVVMCLYITLHVNSSLYACVCVCVCCV